MVTRKIIAALSTVLVVLSVITGCGTHTARTRYENSIEMAYSQMQTGDFWEAATRLEDIKKAVEEKGYDQVQLKCLLAENYINLGEITKAYDLTSELLQDNERNPYACELMGKIFLRKGRFTDAERHFTTARREYQNEEDVLRAKDMLALSKGLAAYEGGNLYSANQYWVEIQDPSLKYSLQICKNKR